jgi:hypothetical protein
VNDRQSAVYYAFRALVLRGKGTGSWTSVHVDDRGIAVVKATEVRTFWILPDGSVLHEPPP